MAFETFQIKRFNYIMASLLILLSILGFCVNGVIPTASTRDHGASPLAGWAIVAACFAGAAIFIRRANDRRPLMRIDANGLYARAWSDATIPWNQITRATATVVRGQAWLGFELREPSAYPARNAISRASAGLNRVTGFGSMTVNVTYMSGGMRAIIAAIRQFWPDLFA